VEQIADGILASPLVMYEAVESYADMFSNEANLAQTGTTELDMAATAWIYLESSTGPSGIQFSNDNGAYGQINIASHGSADYVRVYASAGDIWLATVGAGTDIELGPVDQIRMGMDAGGSGYFETDGFQSMAGTARPYITRVYGPSDWTVDAASPPSAIANVGVAAYRLFDASTDELVDIVCAVPPGWDVSSGPRVYLHWMPSTTDTNTVTWAVEWFCPIAGEAMAGADGSFVLTDDGSGTAWDLEITGVDALTAGNVDDSVVLYLRVSRDADASRGGADDDYPDDAALLAVELRWVLNAIGGDDRW